MDKGYIYILSNPTMPGLLKIGRSVNGGRRRAKEIYTGQTGVPAPFQLEFEIFTEDYVWCEVAIHEEMECYRYSPSREFFRCDIEVAIMHVARVCLGGLNLAVAPTDEVIEADDLIPEIYPNASEEARDLLRASSARDVACAYHDAILELDPVNVFEIHRLAGERRLAKIKNREEA